MARPRKSPPTKTSFGKRSDAEKSFYHKKKERPEKRFDSERPRSAGSKFTRPEGSSSFTRKPRFEKGDGDTGARPRFSKPFSKGEGAERPFRKSSSFGSRAEGPSRFGKKPFSGEGKEGDKPFRKSSSFGRSEGGSGFSKRPFQKRDEGRGDEKPPRRSTDRGERSEGSARFEKKPFQKRESAGGEKKPFRRSDDRGERSEGPPRFDKKAFQKRDFDKREDKPFQKRESKSFDARPEKTERPKKSFEGNAGEEKPFQKSDSYGLPYKRKSFDKVRDIKSTKRAKDEAKPKTDSDLIRLNKYIANSGVGSRREADELIKMGLVTVNGEVVTEMGHKVKLTDEVRYEGKKLKAEKPVYILLNKPKGFITTTDDPQDRNTVMNLVASAGKERIYPVGRLDRNTTGLLLLTNDGDLADKLTHPSYNVKKIYRVELDKPLTKNDFIKIKEGVHLEEGKAIVDDLAIVGDDNQTVGIELHIGWNRIVRRIFESIGL
jgi:23S rRNA pseudouridine2605 synthase